MCTAPQEEVGVVVFQICLQRIYLVLAQGLWRCLYTYSTIALFPKLVLSAVGLFNAAEFVGNKNSHSKQVLAWSRVTPQIVPRKESSYLLLFLFGEENGC